MRPVVFFLVSLLVAGCAEIEFISQVGKEILPDEEKSAEHYKVGKPYQINGKWYYPKVDYSYVEQGVASWYGPNFHGKRTANGDVFDMNRVSAAHRTLPLPSMVRVTNLKNGRSLKVKVNDRGPYARNRIIDLSRRAARLLGFERAGTALVRVEVLEQESRRLARLMQDKRSGGGDSIPESAPSVAVTAELLSAPEEPHNSAPPDRSVTIKPQSTISSVDGLERSQSPLPESDTVYSVVKLASSPKIYIQAGAFARYDGALRTQARLAGVGPAFIQQIDHGGTPLFRVRVGPIDTVEKADMLQKAVVASGFPEAQIIVENET